MVQDILFFSVLVFHQLEIFTCVLAIIFLLKMKMRSKNVYMIIAMICVLVSLIGYYFELKSQNIAEMTLAIKIGYMGKVFVMTFLIMAFNIYYKWNLPKWFIGLMIVHDLITQSLIMSCENHKLFYTSIEIKKVNGHYFCDLGKGLCYYLHFAHLIILLVIFMYMCIVHYMRTAGRERRLLAALIMANTMTFMVYGAFLLNVFGDYDIMPSLEAVYMFFIVLLIARYGLFNTVDAAHDKIVEESHEGIIVIGSTYRYEYANEAAMRLFPEIRNMKYGEKSEMIKSFFMSDEHNVTIGGANYQYNITQIRDNEEIVGYIATFFDVTQLYERNKRMEQLRAQADEANRAKSAFLARMSHEIRTPINAVLGMDEMILRESDSPDIISYAQDIKNAGKSLLALVSNILDFSKIESGKVEIVAAKYKLSDVIYSLVNLFSLKIKEKGVEFDIKVDKEIPGVLFGDEVHIKQAAANFLSNAVKYTDNGRITLEVSWVKKGKRDIMLGFTVRDTGKGVKREDMSKLFGTFQRFDEEKNRNIEGTGLGLDITKSLVEMMNGTVSAKSEYGKGSEFSFVLPQHIVDETPIGDIRQYLVKDKVEQEKYTETFKAPNAKLLVVDDNEINIEVVKALLKKTELQIDQALSGEECLKMTSAKAYDIILMDHMMPNMDGIETLQNIKSKPDNKCKNTPVIAFTANTVVGAKEMYLSNGFVDCIYKPVNAKELEKMLSRYIRAELLTAE